MYLHIRPWTSKGYIYILGSIDEVQVLAAFKVPMRNTLRKDTGLATILQDKDLLESVSKEYHGTDGSVRDRTEFHHLPSAFGGDMPAYNQLTCFEFHRLLVGTLLGYGKTLDAFAKAIESDTTSTAVRDMLAQKFFQYYHLLWWIVYSHMLAQHLKMLQVASCLPLPTDYEEEKYQSYAGFAFPKAFKFDEMEEEEDEPGDKLKRAQRDLAMLMSDKTDRAKLIERWIRVLVAHVGALDVISEFCCHSSQNINISLISVRSPPSHGTSIGDWKALIQSLASHPNGAGSAPVFDADHAIKEIESQIKLDHPDFTRCKIVKAFNLKPVTENAMQTRSQQVEANFVKFSSNRHCVGCGYSM